MDRELLTLAIHTKVKAYILKAILERKKIKTYISNVGNTDQNNKLTSDSYFIKIHRADLSKALPVIEKLLPLYVEDQYNHKIDDGRKRILVTVDLTENSIKICQTAFCIAQLFNAKVKILHVYLNVNIPSYIPFADPLKNRPDGELLNKTRTQMLNLCLEIDKKITDGQWPSINYSYSLREGITENEIEKFILEYKPCLLVSGTKSAFKNTEEKTNSTTEDTVETTNIPVLIIPENLIIYYHKFILPKTHKIHPNSNCFH